MSTQTDYLPWILGGLAAAIAALALVIHEVPDHGTSADSVPPRALRPAPPAQDGALAPVVAPSGPAPSGPAPSAPGTVAAPVTPLAPPIPPTVVPVTHADLPPGQVYECSHNGQRIFSDAPCGDRPAIRQLSEVNRMAASAIAPELPRAPSAQPPPYPSSGADYTPPEQPSSSTESTTDGVILYPVPVLPYRYHGQREEHPRYLPRKTAPAHDLGSSGRG